MKSEKAVEELGLPQPSGLQDEQGFQEKAMLRHPARDPVELGALIRAQIIESE